MYPRIPEAGFGGNMLCLLTEGNVQVERQSLVAKEGEENHRDIVFELVKEMGLVHRRGVGLFLLLLL